MKIVFVIHMMAQWYGSYMISTVKIVNRDRNLPILSFLQFFHVHC